MSSKRGLLLLNLGTPDAPTPEAVGRYLNEFLMDPFVIDIPKLLRAFLVKVMIVPKRKHASAEAYQTIWQERGSPLAFHLEDLVAKMRSELRWPVEGGMRYGNPSIRSALEKLKAAGVDDLTVIPLYPQYAESSTKSSLVKTEQELTAMGWRPKLRIISSFFDHPAHTRAWVELVREKLTAGSHLLLSYHGLPERHLKKLDHTGHCLNGVKGKVPAEPAKRYACCDEILTKPCAAHAFCYRAQSVGTTGRIVRELGLKPGQWSLSFQSRLGRTPWIRPFTDEVIPDLAKRGVKSITVVTPSFTADCLETIEEIGDRARQQFLENGGESFTRVECLNSRDTWVKALSEIAVDAGPAV